MNELQRIQDQIARFLDGEAWHGPALMEVLSGVDVQAAMARPIPGAHTIWEILLHVSASVELVLARLRGEARTLSPEEDWPAPPAVADQNTWEADVCRLAEVHRELIKALSALRDPYDAVRVSTATVLAQLGDLRAVEPLIGTLQDTEGKVRQSAARALGQLGAPRAVEPLITTLQDQDAEVRAAAAWALGDLGDPRAAGPLHAALDDPVQEVRWSATSALQKLEAQT